MSYTDLENTINAAWDDRDNVSLNTQGAIREAVEEATELLDSGKARVAERVAVGEWTVNQWLKKAVLLSFRLNDMKMIENGPGGAHWFDKVDSKFLGWDDAKFRASGIRAVPNCIARRGAYIAPGVVDRKSVVQGTRVEGGRRSIIQKVHP